ncbi:hypothetical protein C2857_001972 [Epichloe festucae Fl1]|uniref:Involucrin repeat protein n=1 Tax=Epichloe festucae (strain Fl1) TaxID=877507 RepID=A0A7S9KJX2_EPIFF|nr:hypothetical protein C2857_001972 [Epichloe festucae Fl1]
MNTPEKRRSNNISHVLRTGPGHATRHNSAGSNSMPALPPRAVMINNNNSNSNKNNAAGPEVAHEPSINAGSSSTGGAPLADMDKETVPSQSGSARHSTKGKQKERDERNAALLRDKDERITNLEMEMATMEREFTRELDKLSRNESETATFWQAKHSALNQQFLRTDTELRVLRSEVEVREAERSELRQAWDSLRREVKERDDEIRLLGSQLRDMKKFVSTSTRTDGQTSDEVFGEGMARLGNGLQNWVITNFRRAKLADFAKVDEATLAELGELVPMYEELAQGAKVHLLQSIVSRLLVDMVFGVYFPGLSDEQTQHFRQMEKTLSQLVLSEESINQWRASTLGLLRRDGPRLLRDETNTQIEKVTSRINRILDTITTDRDSTPSTSASSRSDARDSSLRTLATSSVELARLLVAQKAILRVHMPEVLPHQQVLFDPGTMEDVGGEDEDALASRDIRCVVFPGVIKHGDENGGQMQFRNVIAKARVLCGPED